MNEILNILSLHITEEEIDEIHKMLNSDCDINKILISPDRAKRISDILFINRATLAKSDMAIALFASLNKFYDANSISDIDVGNDSLMPSGTCDLTNFGRYSYESPY